MPGVGIVWEYATYTVQEGDGVVELTALLQGETALNVSVNATTCSRSASGTTLARCMALTLTVTHAICYVFTNIIRYCIAISYFINL